MVPLSFWRIKTKIGINEASGMTFDIPMKNLVDMTVMKTGK